MDVVLGVNSKGFNEVQITLLYQRSFETKDHHQKEELFLNH